MTAAANRNGSAPQPIKKARRRISVFEARQEPRDLPTMGELQAAHLLARHMGDSKREWLFRETLVRRLLRAQREARRATRGEA